MLTFKRFSGRGLLATLLLVVSAAAAFAHGTQQHAQKQQDNAHMDAMRALKEQIPAAFRVMERTPVLPDRQSLAQGRELYLENCASCHGQKGDGQGPAAAALETQPANFLDVGHSSMYGPGDKYWIIENGFAASGMPAFPALTPEQRWHLVNYILALPEAGD